MQTFTCTHNLPLTLVHMHTHKPAGIVSVRLFSAAEKSQLVKSPSAPFPRSLRTFGSSDVTETPGPYSVDQCVRGREKREPAAVFSMAKRF